MIKNVCKNIIMKNYLKNKINDMLQTDISIDFDFIVNSTSNLEFYAYYHEKFVKSPLYKNFDVNKMNYQKTLYERKFNTVKKMVNINNKYILDIGQEDGYYSKLFNDSHAKMIGINVDLTMNYKGDKNNIIIYDGTHIPFPNDNFDIIVMHMVLHHVMTNYYELLTDIYRVLKKSGVFIIEDHDFTDERTNNFIDIYHFLYEMVESVEFNMNYYNNYEIRRFSKNDLIKDLTKIGFKKNKVIIGQNNPLKKFYLIFSK